MASYPPPLYGSFNPDDNYSRYVGWNDTSPGLQKYFSPDNVRMISAKITDLLQGVDPGGRPIVVTDRVIGSVLSSVYNTFTPQTGDIYSRYNIPNGMSPENYLQSMIDQTIEIIVNNIRDEYEMIENNRKLTIWSTVYGDFNAQKLRAHPQIKIRKRRPDPMQFNMNY